MRLTLCCLARCRFVVRKGLPFGLAVLLAGTLLLACGALPPLDNRPTSHAFTDTAGTRLGKAIEPLAAAHPGTSGVYPLLDSREAFAVRVRHGALRRRARQEACPPRASAL
jgi:putative cardiolipin synthase